MLAPIRIRTCLYFSVVVLFCVVLSLAYFGPPPRHLLHRPPHFPPNDEHRPSDSEVAIPRRIWQIFFPPPGGRPIDEDLLHSTDWVSMAPGYTYTMVGDLEAAAILDEYYGHRPEVARTFHALKNPALKSDFLRYLILLARGGTYSDVDTKPIVKLEDWLSPERRSTTRLVLAIEYDESLGAQPGFQYPVQFCQWTISSAPRHTVMSRMVDRVLTGINDLAAKQGGVALDKAVFSDFDVLNTTGPVAWSEVVYQTLRDFDPTIKSHSVFFDMKEPRYVGDIAVLPIWSFKADYIDDWGVSWRKGRRTFVRHFYKGGWRTEPVGG